MQYYGITDIGMQRKENQDRIYMPAINDDTKLFIVADGMGGANAGGVASSMAIEYVKQLILEKFDEVKEDRIFLQDLIKDAIVGANKYIYEKSLENEQYSGMGTTIVVAIVYKGKVFIGHVGDSRIYRIRKHIIRQLTKDHSYVQILVQNGTITREEAENHPQKNMLVKALGCEETVEPDVMVKGFLKDDILLMCTDGLTNMIKVNEIYEEVINGKDDLVSTCNNLISHSKKNGGYDNISVILIFND